MFFLIQFVRNFEVLAGKESKSRINSPDSGKRLPVSNDSNENGCCVNPESIARCPEPAPGFLSAGPALSRW
jgi:hypothetical protein